ncbi:hypothetical protein [Sphingobium yanoikuyae]|uniref:hypothetical protein n=1 Tax=Sphingobium yanoikuyae TaxID=13690 RepID=UPI0009B88325|nr:hypothetical protein [Sphingobium yanoikuyae]
MFPKTGNILQPEEASQAFIQMISHALVEELGRTHQAVKTAVRWTGASERSVKHWLAGTHAPQGPHLLCLMRHSNFVLGALLAAAGRNDVLLTMELSALRQKLADVIDVLDRLTVSGEH